MTKLTEQEQSFYSDLINDEIENKDLSILNVFFFGGIVDKNFSKKAIPEDFQNQYADFFENSIFLFSAEKSSVIGKYKEYFWYSNEDGNLSYIGKSIDDIIYTAFSFWTGNFFDERQKEDRILDIENKGFNYDNILNDYQSFCKVYGYDFHYDYLPDLIGEKEFNEIIK